MAARFQHVGDFDPCPSLMTGGRVWPRDAAYRVPSSAMLPTLRLGEHVTVSINPEYAPSVQDIIVFHPPAGADFATLVCGNLQQGAGYPEACGAPTRERSTQRFIKRIMAAPGDTLQMRHNRVIRNGETQEEPYILAC